MKKMNMLLWLCLLAIATNAQYPSGGTRVQKLRYLYLNPQDLTSENGYNNNRIWIMAHRGVWRDFAPESSMGALQYSVTEKFDILELDVRFSAPYIRKSSTDYVKQDTHFESNGVRNQRWMILEHDKSDKRAIKGLDGKWKFVDGLFKFGPNQTFDENSKKKSSKCGNLNFTMCDKLVPRTPNGLNCLLDASLNTPSLLLLNGDPSSYRLIAFPINSTAINYTNDFVDQFVNLVKGKILLNIDKLKDPIDFRDTYDFMDNNGLLGQTIFKNKGVTGWWTVNVNMFGNKNLQDKSVRNLSNVMYTPIFTKFDYVNEDPATGVLTNQITNNQKFLRAKDSVDHLLQAERDGRIRIPGCEIVYVNENENDPITGWLVSLAKYVKANKKRVIQFSTIPESRYGAWSGNSNFWEPIVGRFNNYWHWLYDNPTTKPIRADVFVGDKVEEFRAYLNSVGYNQKPLN